MLLQGFLSLSRETAGTVALVAAGDAAVLAVAITGPDGHFAMEWAEPPPGSALYGFPGKVLRAGDVAEALEDGSATIFAALVPPVRSDRSIDVDAGSTREWLEWWRELKVDDGAAAAGGCEAPRLAGG